MENSRSKSKSGARGTARAAKSTSSAKSGSVRRKATGIVPGEDEIRAKAQELYNDRIFRGESGTAEGDWLKAEKLLRK
jgi:hypothetical protein